MKSSSILMSSFGALLILISVRENTLIKNDFESKPEYTVTKVQPIEELNLVPSAPPASSVSKNIKDFSYLKFNVSGSVTAETGTNEISEAADFSFLKFNVSDYTQNESSILPEDSEFDYLKFNVNDYITGAYNEDKHPSSNLDYLKFDVQTICRMIL